MRSADKETEPWQGREMGLHSRRSNVRFLLNGVLEHTHMWRLDRAAEGARLPLSFWADHRQVEAQRHMDVREGPERYQGPQV